MTERAYAKINLWLEIIGKLSNGYHSIQSVMQTVSLYDDVEAELSDEYGVRLICPGSELPCDSGNIAYRSAELFLKNYGIKKGVDITIKKHIPLEAGLAGGSADAAAVLRLMNRLTKIDAGYDELCRLGASLGADVPFCIRGGTALAGGIGERLTRLEPVSENIFLTICKSPGGMSTALAYASVDKTAYSVRSIDGMLEAISSGNPEKIAVKLFNRFEDVVPIEPEIKTEMMSCGAMGALMTGSGTAVFGIFSSMSDACKAEARLREHGYFACAVHPVKEMI